MTKYYELVIDGEVATHLSVPSGVSGSQEMQDFFDKLNAALSSNPTVIPVDELVPEGFLWNGENFHPPVK